MPRLEHVNVTVRDAKRAARLMEDIFGWPVRWEGPGQNGHTVHVGSQDHYLALHAENGPQGDRTKGQTLNHIGVEVDDLDGVEARVLAAGLTTYFHADYAPGRRFYFRDHDGLEYEVVSYR